MMSLIKVLLACWVMSVAGSAAAAAVEPGAAAAFVDSVSGRAIAALSDTQMDSRSRMQVFGEILDQNFSINRIARFVLGRWGRTASATQMQDFSAVLRDYLLVLYADRLKSYNGQKVEVMQAAADAAQRYILVDATVVDPSSGGVVALNWRLLDEDGGLKIVDISVEGISMSVALRSEFNSVIQANGGNVDALIALLREKTVALQQAEL